MSSPDKLAPEPSPSSKPLLLGLFAAATYSVANLALRGLSKTDAGPGWDMWVAGTKAFPTFFIAIVLIALRRSRGQHSFAAFSVLWPIAVAAFFNQLGGNFAFQMSLRMIGLAISVPICFASIICSGAVAGRIFLGDQVTLRNAFSMTLMVTSIIFLSAAAKSRQSPEATASSSAAADTDDTVPSATDSTAGAADTTVSDHGQNSEAASNRSAAANSPTLGVVLSVVSGLCYGVSGVFIRRAVRSQMPVAATLFLFSTAGFLLLCPASLLMLPISAITNTTASEWITIAIAGIFNAIGFFAITHAMRTLTISRANVINASQNAMCAVGAMVIFSEPLSPIGLVGIGLTITGLLVLDRR
ncbi:MAG: EamA family transporter [Planctomycetota bacterium]